jgi:hypothetical protein
MSINRVFPVASIAGLDQSDTSALAPARQAWKALGSQLDSGDLKGAQSAFATVQRFHAAKALPSPLSLGQSQLNSTIAELNSALQAGDISAAQAAFAAAQSQLGPVNIAALSSAPRSTIGAQPDPEAVSVELSQKLPAQHEAELPPLDKLFTELLRRWNMKIDF